MYSDFEHISHVSRCAMIRITGTGIMHTASKEEGGEVEQVSMITRSSTYHYKQTIWRASLASINFFISKG